MSIFALVFKFRQFLVIGTYATLQSLWNWFFFWQIEYKIYKKSTKRQRCYSLCTRQCLQIPIDEKGFYRYSILISNFWIQILADFVQFLIKINTKDHNL